MPAAGSVGGSARTRESHTKAAISAIMQPGSRANDGIKRWDQLIENLMRKKQRTGAVEQRCGANKRWSVGDVKRWASRDGGDLKKQQCLQRQRQHEQGGVPMPALYLCDYGVYDRRNAKVEPAGIAESGVSRSQAIGLT